MRNLCYRKKNKTMKNVKLILLCIFLINITLSMKAQKSDYEKGWKLVEKYDYESLPKSAIAEVDKILSASITESNTPQLVKAVLYRTKYTNLLVDNGIDSTMLFLENLIRASENEQKALLFYLSANYYYQYYLNNKWEIIRRTALLEPTKDFKTWTVADFAAKIHSDFENVFKNAETLKSIPMDEYKALIDILNLPKEFIPSVYDFLLFDAIRFYSNSDMSLVKPKEEFSVNDKSFFKPLDEFCKISLNTDDSASFLFRTIHYYQVLLRNLQITKNRNAILYADLERLNFIRRNNKNEYAPTWYLDALNELIAKNNDLSYVSVLHFQKANLLVEKANEYNSVNPVLAYLKNHFVKADSICDEIILKYPKSYGAEQALALKDKIRYKSLSFDMEQMVAPAKVFPLKITYRNTQKIHIRIASIKKSEVDAINNKYYSNERYAKILKAAVKIYDYTLDLPDDKDFRVHSVEFLLDSLPIGYYAVFVADNAEFSFSKAQASYQFLSVTEISYFVQNLRNSQVSVSVLNRSTGLGMEGVKAEAYSIEYDYRKSKYIRTDLGVFETDKNGQFSFNYNENNYRYINFDFTKANDFLSTASRYYVSAQGEQVIWNMNVHLFTDRAIYRPGQVVYFKGIMIKSDGKNHQIVSNENIKITLLDFNGQMHSELTAKSNEYGSFSGQFVLPQGQLNGRFIIETSYGSLGIQVEEYKRPKFEVNILPFDKNYRLGEVAVAEGKAMAYSGASISGAKVKYRITREPLWSGWWWWDLPSKATEIAQGETITADDGTFSIQFDAVLDPNIAENEFLSFNYNIYADVIDINGETHSATGSLRVGYRDLLINLDLPAELDLATYESVNGVFISATNLNYQEIKAEGKIQISLLEAAEMPFRKRYWNAPDMHYYTEAEWKSKFPGNPYANEDNFQNRKIDSLFLNVDFNTGENKYFDAKNLLNLPEGDYVVDVFSKDIYGNPVLNKRFLSVFRSNSINCTINEPLYVKSLVDIAEPGDTAAILIGSAYTSALVLISVEHQGVIIHQENRLLNKEQQLFEWPVEEKYRGNFGIHVAMINQNREYRESSLITVPYSNKKLDIEFATFRDKLLPGQQEEWLIKIKGPQGEKIAAEMLATLYDASLDQFRQNYWNFNIFRSYYLSLYYNTSYFSMVSSTNYAENINDIHRVVYYQMPQFKWYGSLNYFGGYDDYILDEMIVTKSISRKNARPVSVNTFTGSIESEEEIQPAPTEEMKLEVDDQETNMEDKPEAAVGGVENVEEVKVRTNFNETAFFYPHLKTDADGNITVKFTIPESLTKWKMMGMATTSDLKYAITTNWLVTQKELMVVPNAPRFFRENDVIVFPVKISNLSKNSLSGKVRAQFFDATTDKPIQILVKGEKEEQSFEVASGKNTLHTFKLEIPQGVNAISYKVVAVSNDFSDGEQMALPVLSNRMMVTESMPLNVRGKEQKEFVFEKLLQSGKSKTLVNHKLVLEFSSNPAWYAIQALPYLMEYPYECNEQIFNRFYANSLASYIANSSPRIKAVFESWKNLAGGEALLSNLEKNQELKAVLLQETPWVMDGKDESERKKRIALLFDLNKMASENQQALEKLMNNQGGNGGFSWFVGMPESWYISQYIVTGIGHLKQIGLNTVAEPEVNKMLQKAVKYIDNKIAEHYSDLKRYLKPSELEDNHLSYMAIHYLYARSFFASLPMDASTKKAFDYFINQGSKYWQSQNLHMRAILAISLHRFNKHNDAVGIINSLKEHAITSQEMGMFWKDNESGYYWYQAPIETQAVLIEAFSEITKDKAAVEEMKIWLLKQKQTQDWKTTKATADAIYALILEGVNILESSELVEIKLGGQKIDPNGSTETKVEAGTGYFKTSWSGADIKPGMAKVHLNKTDDGIAWGAMYWQYFEDLEKITSHETPLKLKKELFVEQKTPNGLVLVPIKNNLKVGDRVIVRIELRVDRGMEFVHMKDMRASGFEPENVISRFKYQGGLGYYEETKDAATNFFFDYLPKGTYVFEYPLRAIHEGEFSNGITQIQCMYAPEFSSHSEGIKVEIK